jgi:hypothetical protein
MPLDIKIEAEAVVTTAAGAMAEELTMPTPPKIQMDVNTVDFWGIPSLNVTLKRET